MDRIGLAVVDENEIFRRGVVSCLTADTMMQVLHEGASPPRDAAGVLLTIASLSAVERFHLVGRLVICTDTSPSDRVRADGQIVGLLPRASLTPAQLINGVRAAASGLQVNLVDTPATALSTRHTEVLRMLASGAATRQIAESLGYSERTIKHAVSEVLEELGAQTRAEAVALGIRRGLI
ncbi:MAG: helix-turn-helix transcriptional regulator [Chloroflexota bacterium]